MYKEKAHALTPSEPRAALLPVTARGVNRRLGSLKPWQLSSRLAVVE